MKRRSWLSAVLFLTACGPSPVMQAPHEEATSGAETTTAARPSGPPPSFITTPSRVFVRIDVSRVRASPIGPDISSAIRSTESWQRYAGSSGIDPIESFDAIVIGADAVYADRRTILLRHTQTDAQVRDAIMRLSVARGGSPTWSEVDGLSVALPPQTLAVPHSVVLTAEHEVVLTPSDDVARVAETARAQGQRRTTATEAIDASLVFDANEILTAHIDDPPPRRAGWPEPPQRYDVWLTEEPSTHETMLRIHGDFDTVEHCHQSHEFLVQQAAYYASQMLVRAAGLNRPLEAVVVTETGTSLDAHTTFTLEELRRALGAMALMQLQGGAPSM